MLCIVMIECKGLLQVLIEDCLTFYIMCEGSSEKQCHRYLPRFNRQESAYYELSLDRCLPKLAFTTVGVLGWEPRVKHFSITCDSK